MFSILATMSSLARFVKVHEQLMERSMKTPDKQWSEQKDKERNNAERDKMRKQQSGQQQSEEQGGGQQGGWNDKPEQTAQEEAGQKSTGRKPPMDRDRDYDPDGDRVGPDRGSVAP